MDPLLKDTAQRIRLLVLDVDGVLTDGRLTFDNQGNELKSFHTRDGLGLKLLQRAGVELAIISGRASRMVTDRAASLGIEHVFQGEDDKSSALDALLDNTGVDPSEVAYAGDDWIDLPVMARVGLAIAVADADPEVRKRAHWVTERGGGRGAVREICTGLLQARGDFDRLLAEYWPS